MRPSRLSRPRTVDPRSDPARPRWAGTTRVALIEALENRQLFTDQPLGNIAGFALVNPQTDQQARFLRDGATVNLATLPGDRSNVSGRTPMPPAGAWSSASTASRAHS